MRLKPGQVSILPAAAEVEPVQQESADRHQHGSPQAGANTEPGGEQPQRQSYGERKPDFQAFVEQLVAECGAHLWQALRVQCRDEECACCLQPAAEDVENSCSESVRLIVHHRA